MKRRRWSIESYVSDPLSRVRIYHQMRHWIIAVLQALGLTRQAYRARMLFWAMAPLPIARNLLFRLRNNGDTLPSRVGWGSTDGCRFDSILPLFLNWAGKRSIASARRSGGMGRRSQASTMSWILAVAVAASCDIGTATPTSAYTWNRYRRVSRLGMSPVRAVCERQQEFNRRQVRVRRPEL